MSDNPLDITNEENDEQRKSIATELVEIANKDWCFGISDAGDGFAVPLSGPRQVSMLRGNKSLRSDLAKTFFQKKKRVASQQALTDALQIIDGFAQETPPQELFLRVANQSNRIVLDLRDLEASAVIIEEGKWRVEESPVLFRRTMLNASLPMPMSDGNVMDIFKFLNVTEQDRPLLIAWLVACFFTDIPHPLLAFFGEQGTGKSSATKRLAETIDPSPVQIRKPPRDPDSWVTAASGSWVVALDNLSSVPLWLSDSLCRAVTGDGDVRRQLYTDGDFAVFAFRRCIILNGIDLGTTRGDLSERMIPIHLDPISEDRRLYESDMEKEWKELHPSILGGLLDVVASVASQVSGVSLSTKPRMADFARILVVVDKIFGTDGLAHYLKKQNALAADSLTADQFILELQKLSSFNGTSSELLERVHIDRPPKDWPKNARSVTQLLRRQAPVMRKAGWEIDDDGGANHLNSVIWSIRSPQNDKARISDSPNSLTRENDQSASLASHASNEYTPSLSDLTLPLDSCQKCGDEGCDWCEMPETVGDFG